MGKRLLRRRLFWVGLALALIVIGCGKPTYLFVRAWLADNPVKERLPADVVDDASRMNRTEVGEVWPIPSDRVTAETQLRALLERARRDHLHVSIGGARHSMGGHTIYPGGIALDMLPFRHMELDAERRVLHVGAGARWADVIPYLDARGFSVAVMQSNNDFSVGGSISVNCHGWQPRHAPIASTVDSIRLMRGNGEIVRCSREENRELFSLALGGYGLFGVILDVDLRVVPNERHRAEAETVTSDQFVAGFQQRANEADVGLVYGRLCVTPGDRTFLRQAIITAFHQAPCLPAEIPALKDPSYATLRREIYRSQIGSDAGKEFRWAMEKRAGKLMARKYFSRNQLLDEPAAVYREQNADRTDILHEYFVPPDRFTAFLDHVHAIVPRYGGDLLNVTVRDVRADHDVFLRYADQDLLALVMLFSQARTVAADHTMETMTQELIDAVLECGGRFYLPYRLHATPAQLRRAYPRSREFFEKKRQYDPDEIFQNAFYLKYGGI